jgi:WD40 repeat protein
MRLFQGDKKEIRSAIFSPNKEQILSDTENKIKVWNTKTGEVALTFKPHKKEVLAAAFSPDGQFILSGGLDKVKPAYVYSVKLWDMSKKPWWRFSKKPLAVLGEHQAQITTVAFSPDGKYVLSGDRAGKIMMWEIASGKEVRTFEENQGEVRTAAFSFDGKLLITAGEGKLNLWDTTGENRLGGIGGLLPKGAPPAKGAPKEGAKPAKGR